MSIYICNECQDKAFVLLTKEIETKFQLTKEEVEYLVKNIHFEYLNKDTYYFARDLFNRMEKFLEGTK